MKICFNLLCFLIYIILFCNICAGENVKKSVEDNRDDDLGEDGKDDSLDIIPENENTNITASCTRRKNTQMHEIQAAAPNQYPFIVAIMSAQNEYVCAGSIVSNGMILTSAHCTELASYVIVNTTIAKKNESSVILHVIKTESFPTHSGDSKDVALIYTDKFNSTLASKIQIMKAAKIDNNFEFEAIGFGLNAQIGQPKILQSVGLEAEPGSEVAIGFLNCIDSKIPACFKDKGGPIVLGNELIGIIIRGEDECTAQITSNYAINKHMIDFLNAYAFKSWLQEKITANDAKTEELLETYPEKPIAREPAHKLTSLGSRMIHETFNIIMAYQFILRFF